MKPLLANCQRIILVVIASGTLNLAMINGQDVPVEDRVPAKVAEKPVIANLIERLRILRVNVSKLGDKHPAKKKLLVQIEELEKQLAERVAIEAPAPVRSPFKASERKEIGESKINSTELGGATTPSESSVEAVSSLPALQRLNRGVWGENVVVPRIQNGFDLRLQKTYTPLKFDRLQSVGLFPALGLMWGIENDIQSNSGRIWQWQDWNDTTKQSLFLESDDHILDFVFASDFEKTGIAYVLQSESVPSDADGENKSSRRILKLYRRLLDRYPPFAVQDAGGELIAEADTDRDEAARLFRYGQGVIGFFVGADAKLTHAIDGVRSVEWGKGCWLLGMDRNSLSAGPSANDVKILDASHRSCLVGYDKDRIVFGVDEGSGWGLYDVLIGRSDAAERVLGMPVAVPTRGVVFQGPVRSIAQQGLVFGDAATGSIWLAPLFGETRGQAIELCRTSREVLSIAMDSVGEPIVITGEGVFRLGRVDIKERSLDDVIPRFLSDTQWFEDPKKLIPAVGFLEYRINEKDLLDGVTSRQMIGLPGNGYVDIGSPGHWRFPDRTIAIRTVVKTQEWNEEGNQIPLETRVLVKRDGEWLGLRYAWNDTGDDAELVASQKDTVPSSIKNLSRKDLRCGTAGTENCNSCHSGSVSDYLLGFNRQAIDLPLTGFTQEDQIAALYDAKVLGRYTPRLDALMNPGSERSVGILVEGVGGASLDVEQPQPKPSLEMDWFERSLVENNLKHWLDAVPTPNGFLAPNLDSNWEKREDQTGTIVSQSQLICVLSVGCRVTGDKKYFVEMERGCEFLLQHFVDQKHGGFIWSVEPDGTSKSRIKDSYGHAFGIFGLSHAYMITGNDKYKRAALAAWLTVRSKMMDPYGGLYFKAGEDFSNPSGESQNPVMHYFEALLALYDATRVPEVLADADGIASFVTTRLWRSPGFIPEGFSAGWRVPEENATGVHVVIGRQAEWAFLLSHGVELGLSPRYLRFGHKLMDYAMQNGYDDEKGGLGEPPSRQAKESWQQAEFLRALVRYADRHGLADFWAPAEKTRQLIQSDFIDSVHGGWPDRTTGDKGSEWHCGYHEVGMYLEGMRVAKRRGNHE